MIVSVVSMPEGVVVRTDLRGARERLSASGFVIVDIDLGEEPPPDGGPLSQRLGLDDEIWEWLGQRREHARAEFHEGAVAGIVPVVCGDRIAYVQIHGDEDHVITVHHGSMELIDTFVARLRHERPADSVTALYLILQGVLESFRRAVTQAHLEVEDLEEAMFEERQPRQAQALARLRRRAARLHRAFLPYASVVQEVLVRRRMTAHGVPEERRAMNSLHEHTVQLVLLEIESLRDATRRAAGSYSSIVADQQNLVINRLTIVSMIFLPLSFLTGFFGMNFTFLTKRLDTEDSFLALGLGLQAVSVVAALYYVLYRTHWRQLKDSRPHDTADDQL